jgi:hypothetical protein
MRDLRPAKKKNEKEKENRKKRKGHTVIKHRELEGASSKNRFSHLAIFMSIFHLSGHSMQYRRGGGELNKQKGERKDKNRRTTNRQPP